MNDPFDCQEFDELCMNYRGAPIGADAQYAYEKLQSYCHLVLAVYACALKAAQ